VLPLAQGPRERGLEPRALEPLGLPVPALRALLQPVPELLVPELAPVLRARESPARVPALPLVGRGLSEQRPARGWRARDEQNDGRAGAS
jgi:hypothetical protein